jgi:hypothetical protein
MMAQVIDTAVLAAVTHDLRIYPRDTDDFNIAGIVYSALRHGTCSYSS